MSVAAGDGGVEHVGGQATGLLPYDMNASCVKCWGDDISTQYHEKRISPGCSVLLPLLYQQPHLHRFCQNCGHHWPESPMDVDRQGSPYDHE